MKMYIANCTNQLRSFFYRLPETNGVRSQQIDIGAQVQLSGDLSQKQIDSIVEQNGKYGLIKEEDVPRNKRFVGMCYQVDKPVSIGNVRMAFERNTTVLIDKGKEIRKEAAVVMTQQLEEQAPGLQSLEVTTVEEDRPGKEGEFGEALKVENPQKNSQRSSRKKRRS